MALTVDERSIKTPAALETRLRACAQAVEGYYGAYVDEIETRDEIILAASDAGYSHGRLAEWSNLSGARINQIVLRRAVERS